MDIHNLAKAINIAKKTSTAQRDSREQADRVGSSKPPPKGTAADNHAAVTASLRSANCTPLAPGHSGLAASAAPELRKLAQYEQLCGGAVANRTSFFVPTPATAAQAQSSAADVAATLKAYARSGVVPLVFMEPNSPAGDQLDLARYAAGGYDSALDAYFAALQATGITGDMMGMWVLIPEGNLPVWSTVDPNIYAAVVTKTAGFQKKYFPGSQSSIMLDSQSYPVGSSWGDGHYVSLLPYVQNIPKGLVDSFGLQGFPWAAPANSSDASLYDPHAYLRTDFAVQAARSLGITDIWLNTGTFAEMYADDSAATVRLAPAQRQAELNEVVQLASQVKLQGFTVAIHLFAQNKASVAEATDWSYWQTVPGDDPAAAVFTTFAHDTQAAGIPIWLYDTSD